MGIVPQVEVWGFSKALGRVGETVLVAMESGHPKACILPDVYHIHKGGSSTAGPVVINLKQPKAGKAGTSAACITPKGKEAAALASVKRSPKGFYFNVHTSDHPGGAIRGQISSKRK